MKIIELSSVKNVRDFSYGNIKEKMLLRSAAPDHITDEDFKELYNNYNLRTIIDLRADYEKDTILKEKYDINYYNIPLIEEEPGITKPRNDEEIVLNFLKTMPNDTIKSEKYVKLLQSKTAWKKIFDILLANEDGSILICCHQGKDRTGVICALILYLLGIDYDTIIDDYLLSNELLSERIDALYNEVIEIAMRNNLKPISKQALLANKEYIDYIFNSIKEKYGNMDNFFIVHCDLTADNINEIKKKYCK